MTDAELIEQVTRDMWEARAALHDLPAWEHAGDWQDAFREQAAAAVASVRRWDR